jgi:hypothetical protein
MAPVELIRTSPPPYILFPSSAALRRCYRGDLPARLFIPGALRISRSHCGGVPLAAVISVRVNHSP